MVFFDLGSRIGSRFAAIRLVRYGDKVRRVGCLLATLSACDFSTVGRDPSRSKSLLLFNVEFIRLA